MIFLEYVGSRASLSANKGVNQQKEPSRSRNESFLTYSVFCYSEIRNLFLSLILSDEFF